MLRYQAGGNCRWDLRTGGKDWAEERAWNSAFYQGYPSHPHTCANKPERKAVSGADSGSQFLLHGSRPACKAGGRFARSLEAGAVLSLQFSLVQLLSRVRLFATPWTGAHQASLSITNSQSLLKLISIESVMSSNHLGASASASVLPMNIQS